VFLSFGDSAVPHLIKALKAEFAFSAVVQLQYMPSPLTVRLLTDALQHQDWRVRAGALQALYAIAVRRHYEPQITESLREALPVIAWAKWDENPHIAGPAENIVYEFGPAIEPRCPLPVRHLESQDASRRALAAGWVRGFRSRADEVIPLLESRLEDPEESVRWAAAETLSSFQSDHPAVPPIFVESVLRGKFILGFRNVGQLVLKNLSALEDGLQDEDPNVRASVVSALGWCGSEAVLPTVLGMLSDPSSEVRSQAVPSLRAFPTSDVVPCVVRTLQDGSSEVREQARRLLSRWQSLAGQTRWPSLVSTVKSELVKILETGPPHGRVAAVLAVDDLGYGAAEILPALKRNLQHGDSRVRMAAAVVIGRIPLESDSVDSLVARRDYSRCQLTEEDVHALVQLGPDVETIVLRLAGDLDSDRHRKRSVRLMELLGHAAKPALPNLVRLLRNPGLKDSVLRYAVQRCLATVGPEALQPLQDLLDDDSVCVRTRAIRTLGLMGAHAKPAAPTLMTITNTGAPPERVLAIEALGRIGPDPASALPVLRRLLRDKDLAVRTEAVDALRAMKQEAEPAVKDLAAMLDERSLSVRIKYRAIWALKEIGSGSIPTLIRALAHSDGEIRACAAGALGSIDCENQNLVALLSKSLLDADANVRAQAAISLGAIGPKAKPAVAGLRRLLDDHNDIVVLRAEKALEMIEEGTLAESDEVELS
jgi:HEAT repeat protein